MNAMRSWPDANVLKATKMSRRMGSGGLFIQRPRAVTAGLGIAGVMGTVTLLMGFGMLFGFNQIYVGMDNFITLDQVEHSRIQGLIVIFYAIIFLTSVIRALKPVRIPRFITIAISGLSGVLWFYVMLPNIATIQDFIRLVLITSLMAAPALLLMSPAANAYYGE